MAEQINTQKKSSLEVTVESRSTVTSFPFPLVYEDEYFFAIDKPSGFFVHPPEMTRHKVSDDKICLP
jgi:23S rRNA-/tRNA-specific pseudouridylate synthase